MPATQPDRDGALFTGGSALTRYRRAGDSPAGKAIPLEFQARVDIGPWTRFRKAPGGILPVHSALLTLPGRHRIHIRARAQGEKTSASWHHFIQP